MEDYLPGFRRTYRRFMGIDEGRFASGEWIFRCEQRDIPVVYSSYSPVLATVYRDRVVISVAPRYEKDLRAAFAPREYPGLTDEFFGDVDDFFHDRLPMRGISKMLRLTTTPEELVEPAGVDRAEVMTDAHRDAFFARMRPRGKLVRQSHWRRTGLYREDGRQFVVMEGAEMAADASVSDIDWGGGNIAVATMEKHRRKGYGAAVVARAARWCFENDILPIYWVLERNEPSVRLAESLGFTVQSVELAVRIRQMGS